MLKAWRQRKGFSQSQAATKLGIPLDTLQNWEIARTEPVGFAPETQGEKPGETCIKSGTSEVNYWRTR